MDWLRSDLMTDHFKTSGALILMLGNFGMAWTGIVAISFDSSASSQTKDELS